MIGGMRPTPSETMPNFVVIGAQKAATTSLYLYLKAHPQVAMSSVKETDFFVEERSWSRGRQWYESLFDGAGTATAVGEASPTYTMFPLFAGVPERMAHVLPGARLIYLVRDPIERMRSAYVHALWEGTETRPIATALTGHAPYVDHSRYAMQIEQYLRYFDRDRLLVLVAEDLRDDRRAAFRRVLEFIGVDPSWEPPNLIDEYHQSSGKRAPRAAWRMLGALMFRAGFDHDPPRRLAAWSQSSRLARRQITDEEIALEEDLRERLAETLRPDVARLRDLLGADFKGWGLL